MAQHKLELVTGVELGKRIGTKLELGMGIRLELGMGTVKAGPLHWVRNAKNLGNWDVLGHNSKPGSGTSITL